MTEVLPYGRVGVSRVMERNYILQGELELNFHLLFNFLLSFRNERVGGVGAGTGPRSTPIVSGVGSDRGFPGIPYCTTKPYRNGTDTTQNRETNWLLVSRKV